MNQHSAQTEARLLQAVGQLRAEELPVFLLTHADELLSGPRPFAAFMRAMLREKGILQQTVFLAADLSENYGYKLISEEKHTTNRDTILRLCLAAGFSVSETEKALILYGMAPLYVRFPRDIVFLTALRNGIRDVHRVSELLLACGLPPLVADAE